MEVSDLEILLVAIERRSQIKGFRCTTCGYIASHAWLLRRHSLNHSGRKPYICSICQKAFRQTAHLSGHQKSRHQKILFGSKNGQRT